MSAYVVSGWIIAMGGTAFYVAWTLITERRVAAQVLALDDGATPTPTPAAVHAGESA
jgi:hypothetical protein